MIKNRQDQSGQQSSNSPLIITGLPTKGPSKIFEKKKNFENFFSTNYFKPVLWIKWDEIQVRLLLAWLEHVPLSLQINPSCQLSLIGCPQNLSTLTKCSNWRIFDENFYFWWKVLFLMKIFIFDENFYFWSKFLFLIKIFILDENFYFL